MITKIRYSLITASFLCCFSLIIGCGNASDLTHSSPNNTTVVEQNSESNQSSSDGISGRSPELIPASLKLIISDIVLAPGDETELDIEVYNQKGESIPYDAADIGFISEPANLVNDTGHITVPNNTEIGDQYTIIAQYNDLRAEARITIKYDLQATVVMNDKQMPVVTNPDSLAVVINKERGLPADYIPNNLVKPDVPFSFAGENERKYLQKEAAAALEQLFIKADEASIELFGVSGYRSYSTQSSIYNYNVQTQGEEETRKFSAYPGQSEHQTGLSIDISSRSAGLALEQSFGETEEGQWLEEHVSDFGFIIRYPKGKEHITGYEYEPWHIRYVGVNIAKEIMEQGLTLEEYFQDAIPVSR